jgi:addiction module HigA family antidote
MHQLGAYRTSGRPTARRPIPPGEILAHELDEIGLPAKNPADMIEVPPIAYQVVAKKRNITADTALAQYFGMPADFWINLQSAYELNLARRRVGKGLRTDSQAHRDDVFSTEPQPSGSGQDDNVFFATGTSGL